MGLVSSEYLSLEEIERRYDGQWVVIDEPNVSELTDFLGGTVVFHGSDRDEAWAEVERRGLKNVAVWYMGALFPEGVSVAL